MKIIQTPEAPAAVGPYSQAIGVGGFLFCSGQIAIDPKNPDAPIPVDDVEAQTVQVFKNIKAVLSEAGLNLHSVCKATVFLTDMGDFAKVNQIYASEFADHRPARSCVAVKSLPKGVTVEIEVVAVLK